MASATTGMEIDIGISDSDRKKLAEGLSRLLADTYTLYLKTHNFHWNVTGPMFQTLHLMFETHYNELALAVDLIAERIRALGHPAPATYKAFAKLSSIREEDGRTRGDRDDPQPREGTRGRCEDRARRVPGGRVGERSAHARTC